MKARKVLPRAGKIFISILIFLFLFLALTIIWAMRTWTNITFDEIIFHLTAPTEGTSVTVIRPFILTVLLPAVIIFAAILAYYFISKNKRHSIILSVSLLVSLFFFIIMFISADRRYGIISYLSNINKESTFVTDNYILPSETEITFPDKKRNLVYIFLESMEMTYSGEDCGGAFPENVIPNLTELALSEGECFSGSDNTLNGAIPAVGATYTMGTIVSHTSGNPVIPSIISPSGTFTESFYPDLVTLGDILENEGYNQEFMCGSDAAFAGRSTYFRTHGDFEIFDLPYAMEAGLIPEDYNNGWWGYEDEKLFSYAKDELTRLSGEDQPFNLTLLTVDTHFENGYICRLCDDEFSEKYANVMACSDRQVSEFVKWIREQDFSDNTTIIIAGDHLTMDSDFCENVPDDYQRRIYFNIIEPDGNAASDGDKAAGDASDSTPDGGVRGSGPRAYTSFDIFPTTLAALGCTIEGDRLGLGTNLYSDAPTLLERYSIETINSELVKNADYLNGTHSDDPFNTDKLSNEGYIRAVLSAPDAGTTEIAFKGIENIEYDLGKKDPKIRRVYATLVSPGGAESPAYEMKRSGDNIFTCTADRECGLTSRDTLRIYAEDTDSGVHLIYEKLVKETGSVRNAEQIVSRVKADPALSLFISFKDSGLAQMPGEDIDTINSLGFNIPKDASPGDTYYGIYDGNTGRVMMEDCSDKAMSASSELSDGTAFTVRSAAFHVGNIASVNIGGSERAKALRGMNYVIYDSDSKSVIFSGDIDYYGYATEKAMMDTNVILADSRIPGRANLIIESEGCGPGYFYYWSRKNPEKIYRQDLAENSDANEDGLSFSVSTAFKFRSHGISTDDMEISYYLVDSLGDLIE